MDSREDLIQNEVLRHYREGQISSWIGDEEKAIKEFSKTVRAVNHLEQMNIEEAKVFIKIKDLASITPSKKDSWTENPERRKILYTKTKNQIPFQKDFNITYSFTIIGDNRIEFRSRISIPSKKLVTIAKRKSLGQNNVIVNNRGWSWIEVNIEIGYTATIILTFADRTIFANITTHNYIQNEQIHKLEEEILTSIFNRLNY